MTKYFHTLHTWLASAPDSLPIDRCQTYVTVNYSMLIGAFCHLSFAILFLSIAQFPLAIFNLLFSVPLFGLALLEAKKGHSNNAMALCTVELLAHSGLVTHTLGEGTAFYIFPLALVAIYPLMSWISLRDRILLSLIPLIFTVGLYVYALHTGPVTELSTTATSLIATYNFLCFTVALSGITSYYMWSHVHREQSLQLEIQTRLQSNIAAVEQLDRINGLATFSRLSAHAKSEQEVLDIYAGVIHKIAATTTTDLILVDSSGGPFGTFFERVEIDPTSQSVRLQNIDPQTALRATIARDQGSYLLHTGDKDMPFWFDDWAEEGCQTGMVVPLIAHGEFIGIIGAASKTPDHFNEDIQLVLRQFGTILSASITLCRALRDLESALTRSDNLLSKALPPGIAHRLKKGEDKIADQIDSAGIFFCDLVGFTKYSSQLSPSEVVTMLEEIFGILESQCNKHGVEKIKTIGDCFMAVSGVSNPVKDPSKAIANFALDAADALSAIIRERNIPINYRIGINSGPVYAGIIGSDRLFFDIWGDTVNVASRMESNGEEGEITCPTHLKNELDPNYSFSDRGTVSIKGKGERHLWSLTNTKT